MKTLLKLMLSTSLIFSLSSCTTANKPSENKATENENAQWVEVLNFKGNGMKSSKSFDLEGGESRIKFAYKGEVMGLFAAYVFPSGHDFMKQGGIPDVMVSNIEESGESYLQKSAGRYYVFINAGGNWNIVIEELR